MHKTTNIYLLVDTSLNMKQYKNKIYTILKRIKISTKFLNLRTKLHIWGYSNKSHILSGNSTIKFSGYPNLNEGLMMLNNILKYESKYANCKTRSVIILYTAGKVLAGWDNELEKLYQTKEFAYAHRYVVSYQIPDKYALGAYRKFTENDNKILHHFSEGRLCSLIRDIHSKERRKVI